MAFTNRLRRHLSATTILALASVAYAGGEGNFQANPNATDGLAAPALASEWTTFQHDSQHTGRSPATGPIAPDTASWSFGPVFGSVVVGPTGLIYACQVSGSGWFRITALNPAGTVAFQTPLVYGYCSTPTIAPDGTIVLDLYDNPTSRILAFNADGSARWTSPSMSRVDGVALGADGTVYAAAGFWQAQANQGLYALNPDGSSKWTYGYASIKNAMTPAVAPDGTIVVTGNLGGGTHFVRAHDPTDGSLLWEVGYPTLPGFSSAISAPAIAADGTTYFFTSDRLWAVSSAGAVLWSSSPLANATSSTPAIAGDGSIRLGLGATSTTAARLYSFSTEGTLQWVTAFGTLNASNKYVGPMSIALDRNGKAFVAITPNGGDEAVVPILFIVSSAGTILWNSSPVLAYPWVLSASGTLYGVSAAPLEAPMLHSFPPPPLSLSVADASAPEGAGQISVEVSLSAAPTSQVSVDYATSNGSALDGTDYLGMSGTLTFDPGTTTRSVLIPLIDDASTEPNESFSLNLSGATGAELADSRGSGTILNDDEVATLSIGTAAVTEGHSGTASATFTVTLSPAATSTVAVTYQTLGGTATPGNDFTFTSGVLTFTLGQASQAVTVPIVGDTLPELNETFTVTLSGAVGAVISGGGQGAGTILDDDSGGGAAFEAVDPTCESATACGATYLSQRNTCGQTAFLSAEPSVLLQASVARRAVVADGVTLLLLKMPSSVPVVFSLRHLDGTPPTGEELGALMDRNACNRGTEISINPEQAGPSVHVFATYQAPNGIGASAWVRIVATPQGGPATWKDLELRRPPVVLVHGVWSGPDAWRGVQAPGQPVDKWTRRLAEAGFDAAEECLVDYSETPAASFDPVDASPPINALVMATHCARRKARSDQNAAVTQVDVVGHSMGGLTARARVKSAVHPYYKVANLAKGEFHKIITVGTPHQGTGFADMLAERQCATPVGMPLPTLASYLAAFGRPMGPAIFGFQTSSEPIAHLGMTPVPGHAVAGIAPALSDYEALFDAILPGFSIFETVDGLLGGNGNHDVIVPVASQRGGLSGSLTSTMTDVTHMSELTSPDTVSEVLRLLDLPASATEFGSFPAFQPNGTYRGPYVCVLPLPPPLASPASGALVVTPTAGEVYRPGEPVRVSAALTGAGAVEGLALSLGGEPRTLAGGGPWSLTFTPSTTKGGRVEILATTYGGDEVHTASTHVVVLPAGSPILLTAAPTPMSFDVLDAVDQIRVAGLYDDGGEYDLTSAAAGTSYVSSSTAVVTVTADGAVQARGDGVATISVTNGTSTATVDVTVAITNAAPTLAALPRVTVLPGGSRDIPVSAVDPDGDVLSLAGGGLPAFATVIDHGDGTGIVRLQPTQADLGSHLLLISVVDDGTPPLGAMRELRVLVRSPKGDIDRDSATDLVFRSTINGAQNKVWLMNGVARRSESAIVPDAASADWRVRGVDDFDGDGANDLVFWNQLSGVVEFWIMNGTTRAGAPLPVSGAPTLATNWDLAATADFSHDGQADILWRNTTSQKIVIWTMNGTMRAGALFPVPDQAVNGNWAVVGALDYNADGNTDLLWYNPDSGKIVFWFMDAAVHRLSGQFANPASAGNNNWKVLAAGDYGVGPNGVLATQDLVWRNATSGKYVVWHMDAAGNRTAGVFTSPDSPTPALDWILVGPR